MADQSQNTTALSSERRQSSGAFANLMAVKRDPNNATLQARRQSLSEMKTVKPGYFGKMWHDWTKGGGSSNGK